MTTKVFVGDVKARWVKTRRKKNGHILLATVRDFPHRRPMSYATLETLVGPLLLTEEDGAITCVEWGTIDGDKVDETPVLQRAMTQLVDYFSGKRTDFDLPLRVKGSPFQRAVCDAMLAIPFGDTCTYGDIAKALNAPAQAVGQACGGNPIPVIIPCHRVLGAASLGGFSGGGRNGSGIETKVLLLRHEGAAGLLI